MLSNFESHERLVIYAMIFCLVLMLIIIAAAHFLRADVQTLAGSFGGGAFTGSGANAVAQNIANRPAQPAPLPPSPPVTINNTGPGGLS